METTQQPKIAVLIPCYNEEAAVGKVIDDFRRQLPTADIVVFDNNSTDQTAAIARSHGAQVIPEPRQGKGFAVETMFSIPGYDLYVMVDGDDTYPAESVHALIRPVREGRADMAVGSRLADYTDESFRNLHIFGNKLVRFCINKIMGSDLKDILSGYRVFNRRIRQTIPVVSSGFENETELTIQTLYYQRTIIEVPIPYRRRPAGSASKLHTFRDGFRVLWKLFSLYRSLKPLTFFGGIGLLLFVLGLLIGSLPIHDYFTKPNHYVEHVPSAILAASIVMLSWLFVFAGLILHMMNRRFRELHNVLTRQGG
ncbi:MAG: glycosyltransferase family 2 protein [Planctomycetales bacterium]|nr:glycosyltransferase family 2 protein [Planctomycetales bacterium]